MADFLIDSFTDVDGTALTAHTGEGGVTWTHHASISGTDNGEILDDRATVDAAAPTMSAYYASEVPPTADYSVEAVIYVKSLADTAVSIGARYDTATQTGYEASLYIEADGDCYIVLWKYEAGGGGAQDLDAVILPDVSATQTITLRLSVTDATKKVYVDGVEQISSADNDITDAGRALIRMFGPTSDGLHIDSIRAYEPSVEVDITLPMFTLDAGDVDRTATVDVTFPALTLDATVVHGTLLNSDMSLPMFTVTSEIANGIGVDLRLPAFELSSAVDNGPVLSAELTLPMFSMVMRGPNRGNLTLPTLLTSATMLNGSVGAVERRLPKLSLSSALVADNPAAGELILPRLSVSATMLAGKTAAAAVSMPHLRLVSSSVIGNVATGALSLPAMSVQVVAHGPQEGVISVSLPGLFVSAIAANVTPATFRTWVLNLRRGALTEYNNFTYNSFAQFNGQLLAASSDGLFALDNTDTDDGEDIDASVITAQTDFGSTKLKRVPRLYVGYKSAGDMELHTITSEDGTRKYLLTRNGIAGIQHRRVPMNRGPKTRYWQFGIANRDGADFLIESLSAYPENVARKVI